MTGGQVSSSSTTGYTLANPLTLNGTVTLGDATNTGLLTFSGATTIVGPTTLTIAANYVLIQGVFGGTGSFNLTSGELDLEGATGTKSGGTTVSGGTLYLGFGKTTTDQLGTDSLTISSGSVFFCGSSNTSVTNTIMGSGGRLVARPRNATVTFSGASAYAGEARIYAGASDGAGTTTQGMTFNAFPAVSNFSFQNQNSAATSNTQTLKYTGTASVSSTATVSIFPTVATTSVWQHAPSNGTATMSLSGIVASDTTVTHTFRLINDSSGLLSFTGGVEQRNTGVLTLTKTGTGPVTLSGSGDPTKLFTGSVTVSAGTLNANSATALGAASSTTGISVTSGATLSLGAAATYASRAMTIGGTGTSSTVGALVVANAGTNQFQSITLGSTTYIRATNNGLINAPFTPNNNSVTFGASAGSDFIPFASLSNVFSGTGLVTYGSNSLDTGIVRADVRHTYTGNTTLAFGTTYVDSSLELAATGGPLGNRSLGAAGSLLMTGGTLSYLGGSVDYSGRFSTAGSQQWRIDTAGQAVTFATALVGASSLSLSDTSTGGSLTLSSASSTFSGGVTITSGTLYAGATQSGVSGPLGITGTITFSPAGTGLLAYTSASASFDYSSRFATTAGQTRRINANGESVTFSTVLGGTNALALAGTAGTLTLAMANTYTQGTTLSVGTLKCGNVTSLGTGGLAQANNTTLHVTATGGKLTIQSAHTNTGTGNRTIRIGA